MGKKRQKRYQHTIITIMAMISVIVLSQKTAHGVAFGTDTQNRTAMIGADGLVMNNPQGQRGVPAGGEVVNLKFTGTREDISLNGDMRPNGPTRLQNSGYVIYNKMGYHNGKSLRVIYDVDVAGLRGFSWYDITNDYRVITGGFYATPYGKNGNPKDYFVKSVRVEYEDGSKLPNNVYPLMPLIYHSYRNASSTDPIGLLYNGGIVRLFASTTDKNGNDYGADLDIVQLSNSFSSYSKVINRTKRNSTSLVAMFRGSNPASLGSAFPMGSFNVLNGLDLNLSDANFIQLFPEDYNQITIKDEPVASTDHEKMTIHTTFTQPLTTNYYENFYPLEGTFKIELAYQHPELAIKEDDFTLALGNGTELEKEGDYTLTIENQTVVIRLTRDALMKYAGQDLLITHEAADISVDPSDNRLIDSYEEDGYKIDVKAQTTWETPEINGAISSQKTNQPSEGTSTILYKPEVTGGETVTNIAINSQAKDLDVVKVAQDFTSSYPGDELSVTMDSPDMKFSKMGELYDVPVTISSKTFNVVKKQSIKVRTAEQTSFTYKIKRDDHKIRLQNFENRTDLTNRFSQMIIITPDNVKIVERTLNGKVRVPANWDQPTDLDDSPNMRSYTFPKVTGNAYSQNIEAYLSDLSFEVMSDFDQEGDIQIIFRDVPVKNDFDKNDPSNAMTNALIPQKINIVGKNTNNDTLYAEAVTKNLIIGQELTHAPRNQEHYEIVSELTVAPTAKVTTKEVTYQAIEYTIAYDRNGGQGPEGHTQTYTILTADKTAINDGEKFSKDKHSLIHWLDEANDKTYQLGETLDKTNLPGNMTLQAIWDVNSVTMTVNYFQEVNGVKTKTAIFADLENQVRQLSSTQEVDVNTKISEQLAKLEQEVEFAGYVLLPGYVAETNGDPAVVIKGDRVPDSDFYVNYYYQSRLDITGPQSFDFGTHGLSNKKQTVGLANSDTESPVLKINNSFEKNEQLANWEVFVSSPGLYNETTKSHMNGKMYYKENKEDSGVMINHEKEKVLTGNAAIKNIPLSSGDNQTGLLLDVENAFNYHKGNYEGEINWVLQVAP